ncbi:uncharacterized protein LTR77_004768 [Saxophila tyrrhenica]|uniref:F-box domain-containing protein n=1 Tax=Saxophila tyrrhenica TaxID=1690608 RepID=A0AAV9PEC6_9PEZI|nr:hypothetical protein LTR77_004768 [Saxophila tyrrhenica]
MLQTVKTLGPSAVTTPMASPFSRLPEEMLVLILDELHTAKDTERERDAESRPISTDGTEFDSFKNLRSACREYTYLPRLLSRLFRCIRLFPLPQHMELQDITCPDLSVLRPYVRRVTFNSRPTRENDDVTGLESMFTNILSRLPNAGEVFIAVGSELLFRTILSSLGRSGTMITDLDFHYYMEGLFDWTTDDLLDNLDLSALRSLKFGADVWLNYSELSRRVSRIPDDTNRALNRLLKCCSSTIKSLSFGNGLLLGWPHPIDPPPILPSLQSLNMIRNAKSLQMEYFATYLRSSCPALTLLVLDAGVNDREEYRYVWDAVRDHTSRMTVRCMRHPQDKNGGDDWHTVFSHFTGDVSRQGEIVGDPYGDALVGLKEYLSGVREWNERVEGWLHAL